MGITYPKLESVTYAFNGSIAVDLKDLMYLVTDDVRPAGQLADAGSEYANQVAFAQAFVGVAVERKLATQTDAGDIDVDPDWVGEQPCASATFEVGDLLAIDEAASGTALEDQKLVKTTDPAIAIGYCVKREASAVTTVLCRLIARVGTPVLVSGAGNGAYEAITPAGTIQGDATALVGGKVNVVTGADGTKGVILAGGDVLYVYSATATNGLKIYPESGSAINGGTANAAITIEGKTLAIFVRTSPTDWAAIFTVNT